MKYHFIGICGVSMSGLAQLLAEQGNSVSGSDIKQCNVGNHKKIKIFNKHSENNICADIDEVIYSAAITASSAGYIELKKAQELGIKTTKRSKLIGRLMNDKLGIAIAGTHGKTTVSAMISLILEKAKYDPTCLIGSGVKEWKANFRLGKSKYFVAEACEYDRQFLDFRPKIAVVTNIEPEHLDTYPEGIKEIKQAFKKFIKLLPKNGLLVLCADDKNVMSLKKAAKCKVKIYCVKKIWPGLKLKIPGAHNLLNASAAARVAHELGVNHKIIKEVLNNYTGATRRFEIKGEKNGVTVIDDYGHHPTEIKATIIAAKQMMCNNVKMKKGKLIVVFQPHQYQRTEILFNDFVLSFDDADEIIITDVYLIAGREKETAINLSEKLADEIKKRGKPIHYTSGYNIIANNLKKIAKKGDVVLTIGATNIYQVGEMFLDGK